MNEPALPRDTLPGLFPETRWTLVLRAADQGNDTAAARALEDLCRAYWRPVYAVARGSGLSHEDAEDATQAFFADIVARNSIHRLSPAAGRLRSWLQAALRHQLSHLRARTNAQKRGGGIPPLRIDMSGAENFYDLIPADTLSPDVLYDRHWMLALMDRALARLSDEQSQRGRSALFADLRPTLTSGGTSLSYEAIAARHGLTEAAVKMTVSRLREKLRDQLRAEIAETVATPAEVDDEIRHLFAAFA
jgi:RNA polymerase sigma factor (sigma-70 family)